MKSGTFPKCKMMDIPKYSTSIIRMDFPEFQVDYKPQLSTSHPL